MNNYIKWVVEAFDFNSVKKQNEKIINTINVSLQYIISKIDKKEKLSQDEYCILMKHIGIYKVLDYNELEDLIKYFTKQFGNECNLNWIDVSNITDMNRMFSNSEFNGDISQWDVSNVTYMWAMFNKSKFNGDISQWDVSNVTTMESMFQGSKFNGDISQWNVNNVTNMKDMFYDSKFNNDISNWNVSNVTNMSYMFKFSMFNGDISKWDVSNVTDMYQMFIGCPIKEEYKPKFK